MNNSIKLRNLRFVGLFFSLILLIAVRSVSAQTAGADYVLIVDNSGSMRDNDPDFLRVAAAKLFVDLADDNDRIAIVAMSNPEQTVSLLDGLANLDFPEKRTVLKTDLKQRLDETVPTFFGGTSMNEAMTLAYQLLGKSKRPKFIIMLTDGLPDPFEEQTEAVRALMKKRQNQAQVYAIALGEGADPAYLEAEFTSKTGGLTFSAETPHSLIPIYLQISSTLFDNRYIQHFEDEAIYEFAVAPEMKLTQFSVIVHRGLGQTTTSLLSPPANNGERIDLLKAARSSFGAYYALEAGYELFTVNADSFINLNGVWSLALSEEAAVTVLAQSELGTMLIYPAISAETANQQATRYIPAGRTPYILTQITDGTDQPLQYYPAIQVVDDLWLNTTANRFPTLSEAGASLAGVYTDQPLYETVSSTLNIQIPFRAARPLNLTRAYPIDVLDLPTITAEIAFDKNGALFSRVHAPPSAQIETVHLFVEPADSDSPDALPLNAKKTKNGFRSEPIVADTEASYVLTAFAQLSTEIDGRTIQYSDFVRVATAEEAKPTITATALTDLVGQLTIAGLQTNVDFQFESDLPLTEPITLTAVYDNAVMVEPSTITLTAESVTVPVTLTLPSDAPQLGTIDLRFRTEADVYLQQSVTAWAYRITDLVKVSSADDAITLTDGKGTLSLSVESSSLEPQVVNLETDGLFDVTPSRLLIPPQSVSDYSVQIKDVEDGVEEVGVTISAESPTLLIQNDTLAWTLTQSAPPAPARTLNLKAILLSIPMLMFVGFFRSYKKKK